MSAVVASIGAHRGGARFHMLDASLGNMPLAPPHVSTYQKLPTDPVGSATLTFSGLQPGSDIVVLLAGTSTELLNVDAHGGTSYAWSSTRFASPTLVDIGIFKVGFIPYTVVRNFSLPYTDAVLPINQVADRNYLNP